MSLCFSSVPSPSGRGWRAAPGEGSPLVKPLQSSGSAGAGFPHPALRATFSRREKDSPWRVLRTVFQRRDTTCLALFAVL
jgi:hypothetical protein